MEPAITSKRGGKRNGSGRKPLGKERFTLYLTASNVRAARASRGNVSKLVDSLLASELGPDAPKTSKPARIKRTRKAPAMA